MNASSHTFRVRPRYGDFSPGGHLGLGAMTRFLQEAAIDHSKALGLDIGTLLRLGRTWVLRGLAVVVEGLSPQHGQTVDVRTWCGSLRRVRARRDYEVTVEGRPLLRATSLWLTIDPGTRRLAALPEEASSLYRPIPETALDEDIGAWKPSCPPQVATPVESGIRLADMDGNGHLNNAVYLDMAEDALYRVRGHEPTFKSFRVVFGREIPVGSTSVWVDVWTGPQKTQVLIGGEQEHAWVELGHE
ncbi:MAG: hypothetical protein EOM25_03465 [Deltaproteobacteria bacterium]|nr:hypothetical protein [Deltaproteobacteria bacterium]